MTAVVENINIVADTFKFIDGTTSSKSATFDCSSLVGDNTFVFPNGGGTFLTSGSVTVAANNVGVGNEASTFTTTSGQTTIGNTAGGTAGVTISSSGTDGDAINLVCSAADGGIDIDAGTAGIAIDSTGVISIDSTATSGNSNITHVGAPGSDLIISSSSGSVQLSSAEADASAIAVSASAGGVNIDAAANFDVDIAGGQVLITSADDTTDAIYLHANGGTAETIRLHADQGTARSDTASSIQLTSDVGGITLNSAGLDNPAAIKLVTGTTGGIQVRAGVSSEGTDLESRRIFRLVTAADADIQTTDATPVVLTFSLGTSNTIAHYKVLAVGYNASDGAANCFDIGVEGFAVNVAGTVTRPNANTITTRGTTTATADVDVSGTNIQLTLTGIAAKTINWVGYIEFNTTDFALARFG